MIDAQITNRQFLSFRLQSGLYALPMENILEVVRMVAITTIPKVPAWLLGVINLRGVVLPVIDLRKRLGMTAETIGLNTPIMIVQVKSRIIGLVADSAEQVISMTTESISKSNELTQKSRHIEAIGHHGDMLVLILDLQRVVAGIEKYNLADSTKGKNVPAISKV